MAEHGWLVKASVVCAGAVALAASGLWLLARYSRRQAVRADSAFTECVMTDVAHWVAVRTGQEESAVLDALLATARSGGARPEPIAGVGRIDVKLLKLSPVLVNRTVALVWEDESGGTLARIDREYRWENLPAEARRRFIRQGGTELAWCVFDWHSPNTSGGSVHVAAGQTN